MFCIYILFKILNFLSSILKCVAVAVAVAAAVAIVMAVVVAVAVATGSAANKAWILKSFYSSAMPAIDLSNLLSPTKKKYFLFGDGYALQI